MNTDRFITFAVNPIDDVLNTYARRCNYSYTNSKNYIHYNPVRHQLCSVPQDWEFSSIHRFINQGI